MSREVAVADPSSATRSEVRTGGTLSGLVRTAHAGPGLAVTLLAAAYAGSLGLSPGRLVLVVLAVWAGQLSIGWSNDLVDLARDRTVGRADKPLATGEVDAATVRVACAAAVAATVVLSLACGLVAGLVHLVLVASGWAYNLGVKATPLSWLPYAVAFGGLPAFVSLAGPGADLPPLAVPVAAALLGVGAHLLNVVPDLVDDAATGVRGLGHRLGARRATLLAVAALVAATLVVAAGAGVALWLRAVVLLGVGVLATVAVLTRGRTPFRAAIGIAVLDVLLLVVAS